MPNQIKSVRERLGIRQVDLAKQLGVTQATLSNWERGEYEPDNDSLRSLSKILDVSIDYLLTGRESSSNLSTIQNIYPIEIKKIPLLGDIACGEPRFAEEDFKGYVECGADVPADFALRCVGDSMVNARILDGDIVFIRKQPAVDDGEIAAVIIEDEATLKRFRRYGATVVLHAENPNYPDIVLQPNEEQTIRILGKAIAFQSDVR